VFALAARSLAVPLAELCSSVTTKASGGATLKSRSYGYDDANQVTSTTDGSVTTTYGYDLAGQLTSEVRSGYSVAYAYDANGNRTSRTVNSVTETYSYDAADKLLSVSGGSDPRTFGYDAAGRTTSIVRSSGTTTLSYDYESRITSVSGPEVSLSHTYNGLDTRVATTQNSVSRTFKRDGAYVTDPVLSDGAASYTPSISERRGTATTFLHSGIKNADAQTSAAGSVSGTRVYDAFGAELSSTGSWQGAFGYAGGFGYQEEANGFKLLGHRYYDPSTGRFLTRDPAKDGRNWYAYCGNNPVSQADPVGEAAMQAALPLAGACAAADGPIPAGDLIAIVILIGAIVIEASEADDAPPPLPCPWPDNKVPDTDSPPEGWERTPPVDGNFTRIPIGLAWSLRPDLGHPPPIGPHWDVWPRGGSKLRHPPGPWSPPRLS